VKPLTLKLLRKYAAQNPKKREEWNLVLSKTRSQWGYFLQNPKGKGKSKGPFPNMRAAKKAALGLIEDPMGKDRVWVVLRDWDQEVADYVTQKAYWETLP
jgi:hypothetical protein